MDTLLLIVLTILLIAFAFLLLALAIVPIDVTGNFKLAEIAAGSVKVSWGILGFRWEIKERGIAGFFVLDRQIFSTSFEKQEEAIKQGGRTPDADAHPDLKVEQEGPKQKEKRTLPVQPGAFFQAWPYLRRTLAVLLNALVIRSLSCRIRLGLDDPAMTGILYGWYWTLSGMLSALRRVTIHMVPVFDREVVEGSASFSIRIKNPLKILVTACWALSKSPVRRLIRTGEAA
jgi:hypothetical protein